MEMIGRIRRCAWMFLLAIPVAAGAQQGGSAPDAHQDGSAPAAGVSAEGSGTVVLLHGLGRTRMSMRPLEAALEARGYRVVNLGYPTRERSVEDLADTLRLALDRCCPSEQGPVHFVTHSLGGIVVRSYAERHGADRIGRVVMLSPPNAGSELIDRLARVPAFEWLLGPAAVELGTDSAAAPAALGPPAFEVGVITGGVSVNPLFSWWLPGPDDGKVTVESARLEGARAFLVVPYSHTFLMRRAEVIAQVMAFLRSGRFLEPAPEPVG